MKRCPAAIVALLAVMLLVRFNVLAVAQPTPYVLTDKPLYTSRDKQVLLQGAGYEPKQTYYVWLQGPLDNLTRSTGIGFVTTENGEIPSILPVTAPPTVSLPIESASSLGTYLVSISNSTTVDSAVARAHYGIWGTSKYLYQRTETVQTSGGGVLPKASLKMTIQNPTGAQVYDTALATNETGSFRASWKIPPDAAMESYSILIHGTGTRDDPATEFVSISKFTVTPATLNVTVHAQPDGPYQRTQKVSAEFVIRYPDSTPVVKMKEGLMPVAFYAGQLKRAELALVASDTTSGAWVAERKIQRNATLDVFYRFVIVANAFDDGYGNTGPEKNVETDSFTVVPVALQVGISFNSTHYQIPFDTITAYVTLGYPDGLQVTNATVRAWLSSAGSTANASVTYDNAAAVWVARYRLSLGDLPRPGAWTLSVEAADTYGNSGSASLEIVAELYYFIAILLLAVIALLLARWLLSKYWHRLYLRAKRVSSAFRDRWKSPSLGRHLANSIVPSQMRRTGYPTLDGDTNGLVASLVFSDDEHDILIGPSHVVRILEAFAYVLFKS
ncbi:MAG: hypothetical protein ABSG74_13250 [Candidatus Bathyarchaeia archaeon]|jgi:hypothetical protein